MSRQTSTKSERAYVERIGKLKSAYGLTAALTEMLKDFKRSGSQDLQRGSQWGIPEGSFVPAFTSAASHYLGFVSGLQDIPLEFAKIGGGLHNLLDPNSLFNPSKKDTSGPYGLSQQNYRSLVQGEAEATMRAPVWLTNNFDYGPQGRIPAGQIGAGTGAQRFTMRSVDPRNPMQPAAPQDPSGPLGLVSNEPMPDWPFPHRFSIRGRSAA